MTEWSDLQAAVERAIRNRPGTRSRHAPTGELWLDLKCPLHHDLHRSASFSVEQGNYVCRVCDPGHSIDLRRIAQALAVEPLQPNGSRQDLRMQQPKIEVARWAYPYYYPNAELSHRKWRIEYLHHPKEFRFQAPDDSWYRPDPFWPIYGDLGCPQGAHIPITEGEKATDAINSWQATYDGHPIRAITAGSVQDLMAAKELLLHRIGELQPASLILWPDADEPGLKAMKELQRYFMENHRSCQLLDPQDLQLSGKEDAADFLARGGNLSLLLQSLAPTPSRGPTPASIAAQIVVLASGEALFPGSERPLKLDQSICNTIWQKLVGRMPTDRQAKELLNLLRAKYIESPTFDHYRIWCDGSSTYWRPDPMQDCFKLSAAGIEIFPDAPTGKLLAPGLSRRPSGVDLKGGFEDWQWFCDLFGLTSLERILILAWLICRLTGQYTPLLLMRGESNTGKTNCARGILAIVEPTAAELDAQQKRELDDRQIIRTLQKVPALLIDNVSSMSAAAEDLLSRLVTEYVTSLRPLYSDSVEQVAMRRGVIITSINWDVYKGDLASRMIVCRPRLTGEDRLSEKVLIEMINERLPRIRGYVFGQVCQYYQEAHQFESKPNPWRVASMGVALASLGHDPVRLHEEERHQKALTLNIHDNWMAAVVDLWHKETQKDSAEGFLNSMTQIRDHMREFGIPPDELPSLASSKFARWVEEKQQLFKDHGFWIQKNPNTHERGYFFRIAK